MKKIFALFVLMSCVVILAGCKDKSDKIQVVIGMWPDELAIKDVGMFEEWKRRFEKDYPQYEIKGQPYDYQVDTFKIMAESGTAPTVFQTWFTEPQRLITNGYVKDITDALNELGWLDKMDPKMRDTLSKDGRVYGVPRDGYGLGLFINLNILAEAGLIDDWNSDGVLDLYDAEGHPRYPTTFQELQVMASTISETLENVAGFMVLSANKNGGWQFSNIAWNFGATLEMQNNDNKWVSNLASDETVAAMKWIQDMKHQYDALPSDITLVYNDWWNRISDGSVAMCFVGSDALATPFVNMGLPTDYPFAFVPMPAGPNGDRYSLFGGTPYMFSARATDEEVLGALRFLEYMGRSPLVTDVAKQSILEGMNVAVAKGMPILPTIKPWINTDYVSYMENMEQTYCNVNMDYFKDFYDNFETMKRSEEPYYCQEMYTLLDNVLQSVLEPEGINSVPRNLLESANNTFQTSYLNKINN